jgi:hypothetical protein
LFGLFVAIIFVAHRDIFILIKKFSNERNV